METTGTFTEKVFQNSTFCKLEYYLEKKGSTVSSVGYKEMQANKLK